MITSVAQVESGLDVDLSPGASPTSGERSAESPAELLQKLPPSGRDFEVFERVVVGGGTTRSAAQEFKISQTRVCQILDRVWAWMDEVTPSAADEQMCQRQLNLAVGLAVDRLDFLYGRAMDGWRSSEGEVERTRSSAYGDEVTTRTMSFGDPRYLTAAARLAMLQSKLASQGALNHAMATATDVDEAASEPVPTERPASQFADHPVGACSGNSAFGLRNADLGTNRSGATRTAAQSSNPLARKQEAARRAFFGPVQEAPRSDLAAELFRNVSESNRSP